MKHILILIYILAVFIGISNGSISGKRLPQTADSLKIWEKLDIQSDARIKELIQQHVDQNKQKIQQAVIGCRFILGQDPMLTRRQLKSEPSFYLPNPDVKAYLIFKSPDFKVLVGDFRTKSEALKMQKSLVNQYPNAFIVADEIAFPDLVDSK